MYVDVKSVQLYLRSVEPRDKEVAIMLPQVLGQILATLPGPPLIGKLLDNSCYVEKDGQKVTRYGTQCV